MSVVKWIGDAEACDICKRSLDAGFVDGATRGGPWALMCLQCHRLHGVGLGTGRGQRYDGKTKEKVDG